MQIMCTLSVRKPSGQSTKQESHRISIDITDKSVFPSELASPVVLRSRQCWAVMSGQCRCIVFERVTTEVSWQTQRSGEPPAASFRCHVNEDGTGLSRMKLLNSTVWVWSVLSKYLKRSFYAVKAFSISKRCFYANFCMILNILCVWSIMKPSWKCRHVTLQSKGMICV